MTDLTFRALAAINRARCERWHPGFPDDGWTISDWSNAAAGEMGETCNVVKKLRRLDFAIDQAAGDTRADLRAKLATEIGDTLLYLDLLAQHAGLELETCVRDTFNRVSTREGFPERIPPSRMKDAYRAANLIADRFNLPADDPSRALWWRPWTDDQIRLLNAFQRSNRFHPYTCDNPVHRGEPLVASILGWTCPEEGCPYTQDWAHPIPDSIAEVLLAEAQADTP